MNLVVRDYSQDDLWRMAEIHVCTWRQAYRGMVGDDYLFGTMAVHKSYERFRTSLEKGSETILVCLDSESGLVLGFAGHGTTRDPQEAGAYELYAIYIQPEFQGCGAGSALVREVERRWHESFPLLDRLIIWALEANTQAHGFYQSQGYRPDGRTKFDEKLKATEIRFSKQHKDISL